MVENIKGYKNVNRDTRKQSREEWLNRKCAKMKKKKVKDSYSEHMRKCQENTRTENSVDARLCNIQRWNYYYLKKSTAGVK